MIMHETAQHLANRHGKIVEFPYDSKVAIIAPLVEEQNHDKAKLDRVPPLIHDAGDDHARYGAAPRQICRQLVEFPYLSKPRSLAAR